MDNNNTMAVAVPHSRDHPARPGQRQLDRRGQTMPRSLSSASGVFPPPFHRYAEISFLVEVPPTVSSDGLYLYIQ